MIIHLHTDSRFTNYSMDLFDASINMHLIGQRYPGMRLENLSEPNKEKANKYVFGWTKASDIISTYLPTCVVVHFLDLRWAEFILQLPSTVTIVWIFWGADGYKLKKLSNQLYDPKSKQYSMKGKATGINKLKAELGLKSIFNYPILMSLAFELIRKLRNRRQYVSLNGLFERIDYCGTFLKEDYKLLQSHYSFDMKWIDARFISLEKLLGDLSEEFASGENLLLGNSCTLENNHLDALDSIKHLNFSEDIKVICPLNYGKDLGNYREKVVEAGTSLWGGRFEPLLHPLNLADYTKVLTSCAYAIMYHNRQQAFNNILSLVYLGVKVYLKPENTIYQYLKRIGCTLYPTTDLVALTHFTPLSKEERVSNRRLLKREFSKERIKDSAFKIEELIA